MCLFYSDPISGWPPTAVRTGTSAPVSGADPGCALRSFPGDLSVHHNDLHQLVLRFACRLRHPPERVWYALTDEAELAVWYPTAVRLEPVPGGTITFAFPGQAPFPGAVLEAQPHTLLVFTTLDDTLRWEIHPAGTESVLTLDNTVAHRPHAPYTAAGFHISLSQLTTLLDDGAQAVHRLEMPPPHNLVEQYATALRSLDT